MADTEPLLPKITGTPTNVNERVTREQYTGRQSQDLRRDEEIPPVRYGYNSIDTPEIQGNPMIVNEVDFQPDTISKIPPDYSGYAWLSLLFCFIPLSVAAIYYSNKVLKCIRRGDLDGARRFSMAAKKFSTLAIVYGILLISAAVALYFIITTTAIGHK